MTDTATAISLLEQAAITVAVEHRAVPLRDGDWDDPDRYAPPERLVVSWTEPPVRPLYGAFVAPLGPPADETALSARGVVWCPDSAYAYMGFEAVRESPAHPWVVYPVSTE